MTVQEKLAAFRKLMEEKHLYAYIIPTADYHQSEYVGEYFKCRAYMTGFTGSAGTAVITMDEALLWTDGRYFLQAGSQIKGSTVRLMKMGEPEVPTISEYIKEHLPEGANLGFDGRTVGVSAGCEYEKIVEEKHGSIIYDIDLTDEIWEDRPELSKNPAFLLDLKYAGKRSEEKFAQVREKMKELGADTFLITSLDDIGWMFNIRGRDVEYFPLLLSYLIINKEDAELYADETKFTDEMKKIFEENQVTLHPYNGIYERVKEFEKGTSILIDPEQLNYALYKNLPENVKLVKEENPIILMKAVKNSIEAENIRKAHIKDGIAHTRFMYWLKENIGKMSEKITELSASAKLEEFRAMQKDFLGASFGPICAYREHAALPHYSSTEESNVELKPEGLFLTDTGGHYLEGSTDITRTVALGPITQEERDHFTTVLISMLHLADAKFMYGCSGVSLDYAAREPFWRLGLNYNHGTGHGVGYLGNIHEPPARFHWKSVNGKGPLLEENMVITDEPGIYIEGSHGIRTENELLVRNAEKNEYGQFMYFEVLTLVPIDLDAVNPDLMDSRDKELLNNYHQKVYESISPYLPENEREWLKKYTRAI